MKQMLGSATTAARARIPRLACKALVLVLSPALGLGCDDGSDPQATIPGPPPNATQNSSLFRLKWLDVGNTASPERWLASRQAGIDIVESDPAVGPIRHSLHLAKQRFGDPTRMIANRAVQLEGMLRSVGIIETAPALIETLSELAKDGRPFDGFGAACQNYFNLRQRGLARDVTLQMLKERTH